MHADELVDHLLKSLPPLELLRVAPMLEAEHLSGASAETLKRHYADKVIKISDRRDGMRVIHALLIRESTNAT
jgi:hypothetical protein